MNDDDELDGKGVVGGTVLLGDIAAWENAEGMTSVEGAFSALTPSMWPDSSRLKEDQVQ